MAASTGPMHGVQPNAKAGLAVEEPDPQDPEEVQPHDDDRDPGDGAQDVQVLPDRLAEGRGRGAEQHEDRGKARDEEECGQDRPPAHGAVAGIQAVEGGAGQERQVGRHQRQDAGAQEADETAGHRGWEGDAEHGLFYPVGPDHGSRGKSQSPACEPRRFGIALSP
jgi:hypothetical protein